MTKTDHKEIAYRRTGNPLPFYPVPYRTSIRLSKDLTAHTVDEIGWLRRKMIKLLLGFEVTDYGC